MIAQEIPLFAADLRKKNLGTKKITFCMGR